MEKIYQISNLYVATLRQIYLIEQFSHWTAKGSNFFGNHLVFERLYKTAAEDADAAAEKMIGLFGLDGVDYIQQKDFMSKLAEKYSDLDGSPTEMSLKIEKDFIAFSKEAYEVFKEEDVLSQGLDDLILSIASRREESCYLLQQILDRE